MTLQEIVKFLLCIVLVNPFISLALQYNFPDDVKTEINTKAERSLFSIILDRLRPCTSCLCGRANKNGARFLGGEFTDSHEFPWLANILIKSNTLLNGVLINDRYILTAASPLINSTPPEVKVSLGEYDRCSLDISSVNISVESIIMHPEFNPESKAHNLALVRLSRLIKIEKRISPVCFPNSGSTYLSLVGTVSGWTENSTEEINKRTCKPRKIGLPILNKNECMKSGVNARDYHDDSGCIGIVGGHPIICNGDVGSSVLYRSYFQIYDIVGIFSDANNCNNESRAALYTRVGPHLDWILQQTKDACYCTKYIIT